MSKVLVTGASGFIGRQVVKKLMSAGHQVHAVCGRNRLEGPVVHQLDLLVPGAITALVERVRPEQLVHLAWCAQPGAYWTSPDNIRWLQATLELLEAFARCGGEGAVLAGSCAEYDWTGSGICSENTTVLAPATPYGRCKLAASQLSQLFAQLHQIPIAWARIFHVFGPYEAPARLVPSVIGSLLRGTEARCSHGLQQRDFLHVSDVAAAFVHLMTAKASGVFNVGSAQPVTLRTVIGYLAKELNAEHLVKFGTQSVSENDPPLLVADNQRLLATGWQPALGLFEGLDDALAWWRKTI